MARLGAGLLQYAVYQYEDLHWDKAEFFFFFSPSRFPFPFSFSPQRDDDDDDDDDEDGVIGVISAIM